MSGFESIRTRREGDVLVVTLNRPERLNAAPPAMFDEIRDAISSLDGARAVLIAGEGRAFCSGADLASNALAPGADPGQATYEALTKHYSPGMLAVAELDVPVVSAVRGAAAGIGCSLALAADFTVASETAYFLQAFVNIGLVPDGGASWMLPRLIGRARAAEMMMLGERVPAAKAFDWGMVHKVVADDVLDAEALELAQRLAAGPTRALGAMRRNLHAALDGSYVDALQREADAQRDMRGTEDSAEGGLAFLEKRKPAFKGR
ncbi:enoyl-CoA hydratase-related protein [Sphingomonas tabacisoli]|uniref:Enoyl-CoA hydratase-related protein n=1 Tax=Sphingomonas tabacisoli TaxID=2249466 RepID=A0ABW4HZY6_9SPHN